MTGREDIRLHNVSKFYGDVLGVNRVDLQIDPGITSLVGPNGSGKTTLMNLLAGLIRPTRGRLEVLGFEPSEPESLFRLVGYCTQFDSFPRGMTGRQFIQSFLSIHGFPTQEAQALTDLALDRVGLVDAADRRVGGYSKGMRQRIKLAQAMSHQPRVLILDEPLNGLDPMARAEVIALFREFAAEGLHVLISSHILHEVDMLSDRVILIDNGYIVAEGEIQGVRHEMDENPVQLSVRCDRPRELATRVFSHGSALEVQLHEDGRGLFLRSRDLDDVYRLVSEAVVDGRLELESIGPADEDVQAIYQYLVGGSAEVAS